MYQSEGMYGTMDAVSNSESANVASGMLHLRAGAYLQNDDFISII